MQRSMKLVLVLVALLPGTLPAMTKTEATLPVLRLASSDGVPPVIGNSITGHTRHGLNQVIGRDGGRGVSPKAMLDAARNPQTMTQGFDASGRPFIRYQGRDATVVTRPDGRIITAMPRSGAGVRNPGAGRR